MNSTPPLSEAIATLFTLFKDPLVNESFIDDDRCVAIAGFLASHYSHHVSQGYTPLEVRVKLLATDNIHDIERNAIYAVLQWTQQNRENSIPVVAVIKFALHGISLVIHFGGGLFQGSTQSRIQWFCWKEEHDIKDILIAGGQDLGLIPTTDSDQEGRRLILVCDR